MNKFTLSNKIYIFSGLIIILIGVVSIFVLNPFYNRIIDLNTSIYDKRVQLASYQQQRENIEKTQQDYNEIKKDIDAINKVFVDETQILDLIASLESIAGNNDIAQQFDIAPVDPLAEEKIYPMQIVLSGTWGNLVTYIHAVEELHYYIVIDDLNFTSFNNELSLTLSAKVYSN